MTTPRETRQHAGLGSYSRLPHLWGNANGVLYIVYSDRGIWRRKSTKTKKLAAAQIQLREFVEAGGAEGRPARRLTFSQAALEWIAHRSTSRYGLSPVTLTEYRISVRRVSELTIGKLWLDEIKLRDVRELLQQVEARGATPSMQARLLLHVRMIFRWLIRDELAHGNPAEMVETPRYQRGRRPAVTPAQFEALRAAVREDLLLAVNESDRREAQLVSDLFEDLWHSGLRSIEAMRLEWPDLDLEARTWLIRSPFNKGGEQRLPLLPDLVPILRRRQLEVGTEAGPFAGRWHVRNAWRRFKTRHEEWAGWSLHSLRHGFVTRIRAAAGDAAASHLARHKSKAMTEHYSHFDEETFRAALEGV